MTWAQWEDLIRCAEIFVENDTPYAPTDFESILNRKQMNQADSDLWEKYISEQESNGNPR